MLIQHLPLLARHRIILASASPRRKELLQQVGLTFEIHVSTFEENLDKALYTPAQYVLQTARCKALEVSQRMRADAKRPTIVIGADTVTPPPPSPTHSYPQDTLLPTPKSPSDQCILAMHLSPKCQHNFPVDSAWSSLGVSLELKA